MSERFKELYKIIKELMEVKGLHMANKGRLLYLNDTLAKIEAENAGLKQKNAEINDDLQALKGDYIELRDRIKEIYESLRDFPTDNQGDTTVIVDKGNYTLIIETLEGLIKHDT